MLFAKLTKEPDGPIRAGPAPNKGENTMDESIPTNISDVLADAVSQIERILLEEPSRFAEKRGRIESVLSQMNALRVELDAWGGD